MSRAVRIHTYGGAEDMRLEDVEVGAPGAGQVRLRQTAIGLNFIDVYYRTGVYPMPTMPATLGGEGAGVVEALGEGVSDLKVGDRVAYAPVLGAYAEARLIAADRLVKIPDGITDQQAAAMMLKGMTAYYLVRRTYQVKKGDTVLVQAAAGGVGLIMCQWAKHLDAIVIGTVSSDEKAAVARAHGCDHAIVYTREDFAERVREITGGKGCPVVYDSVGRDTFEGSLRCLRPRGIMASFGESSGEPDPMPPHRLGYLGSIFLTHPSLPHYTATRADLLDTANDLFGMVTSGRIRIEISHTYALRDAPQAHADLEARKTTGSIVLIP